MQIKIDDHNLIEPRAGRLLPVDRNLQLYALYVSLFVAILVVTNIIGTKLFVFMPETFPEGFFGVPFVLTTGILTYPFTFWLTDVVSEIWGSRHANWMVALGFICSVFMLGFIALARVMPPAEIWNVPAEFAEFYSPDRYILDSGGKVQAIDARAAQASFAFTFQSPVLLLFSSMLAYLVAQLIDVYLFHFWKKLTKGKHLWLRNNGSTFFSQFIDTIIVNSLFLFFAFGIPFFADAPGQTSIAQVIITVFFFKTIAALLDTPLIYLGVWVTQFILRKEPAMAEQMEKVL